jgi:hypothetical protein
MAKALLPTLKLEQKHMSANGVIRRQREIVVRVTCGTFILPSKCFYDCSLTDLRFVHYITVLHLVYVPTVWTRSLQ